MSPTSYQAAPPRVIDITRLAALLQLTVLLWLESRKFGGVNAEGAKSGAPELSSWVVSFMRLFSSDGILRAERPGGGASLCE